MRQAWEEKHRAWDKRGTYCVVLQPPFPHARLGSWAAASRVPTCSVPSRSLSVVRRLFATTLYVDAAIVPTDSLGGLYIELVLGTWRRSKLSAFGRLCMGGGCGCNLVSCCVMLPLAPRLCHPPLCMSPSLSCVSPQPPPFSTLRYPVIAVTLGLCRTSFP